MKRTIIIAALIVGLLAPTIALCKKQQDIPQGQWWRRPQVAQAINLTDAEKGQLEAKFLESQRNRLQLKSQLEKEMFELDVLLNQNASDKKMMTQYQKVADARAAIGQELLRFNLEVRKIIGDQRFNKLKNMAKSWKSNKRSSNTKNKGKSKVG